MSNNLERLIKQTAPFKSDYVKAEVGMMYLSSMLNNQASQYFKQYNISTQQYNILRILRGQYPKAININAIKERMLDRMSDVSRIVDRLCKNDLVLKQPNIIDKRNADITISEKGLELLKIIDRDLHQTNDIISNLNPHEIGQLNQLIDKMLHNV